MYLFHSSAKFTIDQPGLYVHNQYRSNDFYTSSVGVSILWKVCGLSLPGGVEQNCMQKMGGKC